MTELGRIREEQEALCRHSHQLAGEAWHKEHRRWLKLQRKILAIKRGQLCEEHAFEDCHICRPAGALRPDVGDEPPFVVDLDPGDENHSQLAGPDAQEPRYSLRESEAPESTPPANNEPGDPTALDGMQAWARITRRHPSRGWRELWRETKAKRETQAKRVRELKEWRERRDREARERLENEG